MGSARALQGIVLSAIIVTELGSAGGCRTSAEPNAAPANRQETSASAENKDAMRALNPPEASQNTTATDSARVESATPAPAAAVSEDTEILPSTRRSAQGLPEPLPDYVSWIELKPPADPIKGAAPPHLPFRKTYVYSPKGLGGDASFPMDAVIVVEEKDAGRNYIGRVSSITKSEAGWVYAAYARKSGADAFSVMESSQCAGCHPAATAEKIISRIQKR